MNPAANPIQLQPLTLKPKLNVLLEAGARVCGWQQLNLPSSV
jgi:hypothetical protein